MYLIYLSIAIISGATLAMQPGINNIVALRLGNPFLASLLSFVTGSIFLAVVSIALQIRLPQFSELSNLSWWLWGASGAIGVTAVTAALMVAPRIGASVWIALFIFGQIVLSILLDHYGWFGFPVHPLNLGRAIGAFLLVLGVTLIVRF